jgi:hypothetical protein
MIRGALHKAGVLPMDSPRLRVVADGLKLSTTTSTNLGVSLAIDQVKGSPDTNRRLALIGLKIREIENGSRVVIDTGVLRRTRRGSMKFNHLDEQLISSLIAMAPKGDRFRGRELKVLVCAALSACGDDLPRAARAAYDLAKRGFTIPPGAIAWMRAGYPAKTLEEGTPDE